MKLLLLGADGQVGWELRRALAPLGDVTARSRHEADLGQPEALRETMRTLVPDVVVNAGAYTAVDAAETDGDTVWRVNAEAPAVLAEETARCGAWLVHYSTDYVFDGTGDIAWRETDTPAPLNSYGRSKLAGEQAIAAAGGRHLIFRTSWVYAARGNNFARTMIRLAGERDRLRVVGDQIGAPTGAELIADITARALTVVRSDASLAGLYHLAAGGETSWCGYARFAIDLANRLGHATRVTAAEVAPITTTEWPTPAPRPLNSRLDTNRLRAAFGLHLPPWEDGVTRMLTEVFGKSS